VAAYGWSTASAVQVITSGTKARNYTLRRCTPEGVLHHSLP
jgi:hypothetical protein